MEQKVIIEQSRNELPEEKIRKRIKKLGSGWRVVSAETTLAPHGSMDTDPSMGMENLRGVAQHVYYVTTVIVEKTA